MTVARHVDTGQIREWGPLLSRSSGEEPFKILDENLTCTTFEAEPSTSQDLTSTIFDTHRAGWDFDPMDLMSKLVNGEITMTDDSLQNDLLTWMRDEDYNVFKNLQTGEEIYALSCKRGNKVYATRKTQQKNQILDALDGKEFDHIMKGFPNRRWTRLLMITVSFDRDQFTMEEAWAALRSNPIEGCESRYNLINRLDANLRKVFGPHGKLLCKEAQQDGYPAPHMIIVLDEPVMVEHHRGRNGESWRLCDPRLLRRIGKDTMARKLAFKDPKKLIRINPLWKHGFIDIQGIVKGSRFKHKKDAISYPFKYLTKCLTEESSSLIESRDSINEVKDKGLRTTLFTHFGNKCFRTRDISYGKGFRDRIGMLPSISKKSNEWKRLRSVPGGVIELHKKIVERKAAKEAAGGEHVQNMEGIALAR